MSLGFCLDPRLEADSIWLGRLALCQLRLMNDARFPWLILIPEIPGISEIHALEPDRRGLLMEEVAKVSAALQQATGADKMNVGALGNLVPQLHFHIVARFRNDSAWPAPVWGCGAPVPYDERSRNAFTIKLFPIFASFGIALKGS
jgi:diadenosine tetraphosphate (Ap4A) HIT family hydrolase